MPLRRSGRRCKPIKDADFATTRESNGQIEDAEWRSRSCSNARHVLISSLLVPSLTDVSFIDVVGSWESVLDEFEFLGHQLCQPILVRFLGGLLIVIRPTLPGGVGGVHELGEASGCERWEWIELFPWDEGKVPNHRSNIVEVAS